MIPYASPFLLSLPPATPNPGSVPPPAPTFLEQLQATVPPAKKARTPRKPKAVPDAVLAEATVEAKTAAPDATPAPRKRKKAAAA